MLYLVRHQLVNASRYKVGYIDSPDPTTIFDDPSDPSVSKAITELIATRDGGRYEENLVNLYLQTFWYRYKPEPNGWYRCPPSDSGIESGFREDFIEMKHKIWVFRDIVLSPNNRFDQELWLEMYDGSAIREITDSVINSNYRIDLAILSELLPDEVRSKLIGLLK
jgi:hypothetical protein